MTRAYVFDAYGTLFNVHAAAGRYRDEIGPAFEQMSQLWRTKHLEYTWIHAQTGRPASFWTLAERSLDFAIASIGGVPPGVRGNLLLAYRKMDPFPEVPGVLKALRNNGRKLAILSNGDPDMLADAVGAAGVGALFDHVLSVQPTATFKPDRRVYQLATDALGMTSAEITFVSSNRWDVAGAQACGFKTLWCNRAKAPDEYPEMPADRVVGDLTSLENA